VSTEVSSSNTIVWLIYWESLEALHHWANSESHSNAMRMYQTKSQKNSNYPLAVMHETYDVPAGHWETIYLNFRPFGLGK
jgi:heme-degrading monooxygenase HmoA